MADVWQAYARLQHVWQAYATYALSRRERMSHVFRRHMPTPAVCNMYTDDIRLLLCMPHVFRWHTRVDLVKFYVPFCRLD